MLDSLPDTEAVICVSDLSAFGALTECQRRGVDVPGRISIGGFGDYEIGAISVPTLTTINPFPREIGAQTAALILKVLDGEGNPVSVTVSIGIACQHQGHFNLDRLLSRADQALYQAKHNGRDRIEVALMGKVA